MRELTSWSGSQPPKLSFEFRPLHTQSSSTRQPRRYQQISPVPGSATPVIVPQSRCVYMYSRGCWTATSVQRTAVLLLDNHHMNPTPTTTAAAAPTHPPAHVPTTAPPQSLSLQAHMHMTSRLFMRHRAIRATSSSACHHSMQALDSTNLMMVQLHHMLKTASGGLIR